MEIRKSAFSYLVIGLFIVGDLYILITGISALGEGQEYPFVLQGFAMILMLALWIVINIFTALSCRFSIDEILQKHKKISVIAEILFVAAVIITGFIVREIYIANYPMEPQSDFKTYYDIADKLNRGTLVKEGPGLCDYISMFPHVYGYPYYLSKIFNIFGTSVEVAKQFNIVLSLIAALLVYVIGKISFSTRSALTALCITTFWPSQIMNCNMIASEYLFSALLLLCLAIFVFTIKRYDINAKRPVFGIVIYIILGILLAVATRVRPMALILLIAIILYIVFSGFRLPVRKTVDQPVSMIFLSKGWVRCALIIVPYMLASNLLTFSMSTVIEREPASGISGMGYNLLVGLNTESNGGWNDEDADYLNDAFERTGSATEAQSECLSLALLRFKTNPASLFNLAVYKYQELWGNDDYGSTWNLVFLEEQGNLTTERKNFLYRMRDVNEIFYFMVVALAGIAGIICWKKEINNSYLLMLIFLGTAGMHIFVESQNRYHYHALFLFCLLASEAVNEVYKMNYAKICEEKKVRNEKNRVAEEDVRKRQELEAEEEKLKQLRVEAMQSQFDMRSALEENLIKVSVTDAYRRENSLNFDEIKEKNNGHE